MIKNNTILVYSILMPIYSIVFIILGFNRNGSVGAEDIAAGAILGFVIGTTVMWKQEA